MKVKQIFTAYDHSRDNGCEQMNCCPVCGNRLQHGLRGGIERPFCGACSFVMYKNPYPAVSVLITENHSVLLGKRAVGSFAEGKWCLPCGYIEYNEDFLTAAAREVQEETGLEVKLDAIISVNSNFLSEKIHSLVVVLLAHAAGGKIQPGDDISELGWFAPESLPEMAFEADAHIIERYFGGGMTGLAVDSNF